MKHILLEIVEATEAAALAASKFIGSGDKLKIDEVATDAMRKVLNNIDFVAEIAIGEGIKDESFGLYKGERVGWSWRLEWNKKTGDDTCTYAHDYDIAVDPVDGTTQTAKGGYEAMSVIAVGNKGSLLATEAHYMNKISVGKHVSEHVKITLNDPIEDTIRVISQVLNKKQITVCMMDRPRHAKLSDRVRSCGCLIKLIQDCDVSGAIAAALPDSGIDLFIGIGGAPEGVISAAAIKSLGGYFEGQVVHDKTYEPVDNVLSMEQLASGPVMFAATGILNGSLLKGVRNEGKGYITHSILLDSVTKSLKRVESYYEI